MNAHNFYFIRHLRLLVTPETLVALQSLVNQCSWAECKGGYSPADCLIVQPLICYSRLTDLIKLRVFRYLGAPQVHQKAEAMDSVGKVIWVYYFKGHLPRTLWQSWQYEHEVYVVTWKT